MTNIQLYHNKYLFKCTKCGTRSPNNKKCFVCGGKKKKVTAVQFKKEKKKIKEGVAKKRKKGASLMINLKS